MTRNSRLWIPFSRSGRLDEILDTFAALPQELQPLATSALKPPTPSGDCRRRHETKSILVLHRVSNLVSFQTPFCDMMIHLIHRPVLNSVWT